MISRFTLFRVDYPSCRLSEINILLFVITLIGGHPLRAFHFLQLFLAPHCHLLTPLLCYPLATPHCHFQADSLYLLKGPPQPCHLRVPPRFHLKALHLRAPRCKQTGSLYHAFCAFCDPRLKERISGNQSEVRN